MEERKLTLKQERFVKEYIKGGNATRAVQEAYPNIKTYGGQRTMASKLVSNGNVQERIQEVLSEAGLTPELIVKELKGLIIADDKTEKNKALRTACELLGLIGHGGVLAQINIDNNFNIPEEERLFRLDRLLKMSRKVYEESI